MKNKLSSAFTLVELLIVIAIIGVLATVLLVTINPLEAQRKARDAQRLRDMSTLQGAMDSFIGEGNSLVASNVSANSSSPKACSSNWTGYNLCSYLRTVPVPPNDSNLYHLFTTTNNTYELLTKFESLSNDTRLTTDGGNSSNYYELGDTTLNPTPSLTPVRP
jgi:prepilin-type N-terminal cleavage/methylation domain-containing protein